MTSSKSKSLIAFFFAVTVLFQTTTARPWIGSTFGCKKFSQKILSTSPLLNIRCGDGDATTTEEPSPITEEPSLDEKVYAAMKKLGMSPPDDEDDGCVDGACPMPSSETKESPQTPQEQQIDPNKLSEEIANDMNVDPSLAMAAIGATSTFGDKNERVFNEQAARELIQTELDLIASIPEDSDAVQELVKEGFDPFFCRRALAFAENNMEDARAILIADQMDADEEAAAQEEDEEAAVRAQLRAEQESRAPDMVEVKTNFDPTALPAKTKTTPSVQQSPAAPNGMPKPARKESVVFEATTAQIQELVLESPVPVLLDIYADWCGPCKVLGPALEEMAIKSGGAFRLVKVNSDNERPVSSALEVTALPTVFGVRDGKIVHMFQGMPRSEDIMRNFMMGLFGAAPFSPPVTSEESRRYEELTNKLLKTAGAASFSFSARERLTDRVTTRLDELVKDDSVVDVEGAASLIRTLLNNVIKNPYEQKYRTVNLENKAIATKLGSHPSCLAVLKSVGFTKSDNVMSLAKGKKVINVAPLVVARDCIDKWIQTNRRLMVAEARRKQDEIDRVKLLAEKEASGAEEEEIDDDEEPEVDPTSCSLKVRLDGKKKVHELTLHQDQSLNSVLDAVGVDAGEEEIQITCVAKKLVVKSSDKQAMEKSLKEYRLMPAAALVIKVGTGSSADASSLKDRVAEKKSRKKGSHTMQSIGIYAKDDNNKAELIDGGGGVWYEHDISDDEDEANEDGAEETSGDDEKKPDENDSES